MLFAIMTLGHVIDQYTSVAVTGAHGKTSTTGLLSHVMNGDKNVILDW